MALGVPIVEGLVWDGLMGGGRVDPRRLALEDVWGKSPATHPTPFVVAEVDQVCDFPCCSQIKCIRAVCDTRLGQPQPRLVLRESKLFLVVELVSLAVSFCLGSKSNRRLPMQPQVHQANMQLVAMM